MTEIRCPLAESTAISKHEPALLTQNRCLLYYELDEHVSLAAARLKMSGCKEGDRVAIFLKSDWPYPVLLLAIMRIGAVACPLNIYLPPKTILSMLKSISCERLITSEEFAPAFGKQIEILDAADLTRWGGELEQLSWNGKMILERPASIIFTSGSSGVPKAVVHTYENHYYSARGSNHNIRITSRDIWLLSLPLYHVGGMGILFRSILGGAAVATMQPDERIEEAQERYGATHVSLVSTQLYRLMKNKNWPPSMTKLKAVLVGGSEVRASLLREAYARKLPIYTSYGLSEMASQVTTMRPDSPPAKRFTSGTLLRYREMKLNEDCEIFVRGHTRFAGYIEKKEMVQPFDSEGWFATGDLGQLDAEGYLTVLGRKDNMFISGGENIQPEEIERVLMGFEDIEEAVVVPVAHEEFGQRPVAFLRGDPLPNQKELVARLEAVLPRYKIPDGFFPWPVLDETSIKIDRAYLTVLAEKQIHA